MAVCVLFNPYTGKRLAVVVNIPDSANLRLARQVAMALKKKDKAYTSIECSLPIIGNENDIKYLAVIPYLNTFIPKALGNDADEMLKILGNKYIFLPIEKVVITAVNDLLQYIA